MGDLHGIAPKREPSWFSVFSPRVASNRDSRLRLDIHLDRKYTRADVASRLPFLGLMTGKVGVAAWFRELADRLDCRAILLLEPSGEQSEVNILNLSNR